MHVAPGGTAVVVEPLAVAVWAMLPAYLPNNAAVLVGGGPPIDGGRTWQGHRLLGDGKTWRGAVGGIAAGALAAVGLSAAAPTVGAAIGTGLPQFPSAVAVALPAGAMLGDIGASFLKRRLGRERGAAVPGLDQLDLVAGALVVVAVAAPRWTAETFEPPVLAAVVVLTPVLHLGTNALAYRAGLKSEPW